MYSIVINVFALFLGLPENEIKRIFKKYPSFYTDNYSTLSDNLNLLIVSTNFNKTQIINDLIDSTSFSFSIETIQSNFIK